MLLLLWYEFGFVGCRFKLQTFEKNSMLLNRSIIWLFLNKVVSRAFVGLFVYILNREKSRGKDQLH